MQLRNDSEHFCGRQQEKVAKSVQCGEPDWTTIGLMKEFSAGKMVGLKPKQSLIGT
jgi:hypothetical protein